MFANFSKRCHFNQKPFCSQPTQKTQFFFFFISSSILISFVQHRDNKNKKCTFCFKNPFFQKTREGCGCFWGLYGSSAGKFRENCWIIFPESRNALNCRISGTGKGKPAENLGSTLPGPCPHLPCGVFFEIDSSSLLEVSDFLTPRQPAKKNRTPTHDVWVFNTKIAEKTSKNRSWTKFWRNLGPSTDSKNPSLAPSFHSTVYIYIYIYMHCTGRIWGQRLALQDSIQILSHSISHNFTMVSTRYKCLKDSGAWTSASRFMPQTRCQIVTLF